MAILGFELEEIRRLITLLETSGVEELVWEEGERSIRIRGPKSSGGARDGSLNDAPLHSTNAQQGGAPKSITAAAGAHSPDAIKPGQAALVSPMMGTFYRAEKPGAPPLVEVGQHVDVGQAIGIIEAMKVFSEIESEQSGVIVAIPVEDGELVQAGRPLAILRRDE